MRAGRLVLAYGDAAAIVVPAPADDRFALARWLVTHAPAAVWDVVVGLDDLVVVWEPGELDVASFGEWFLGDGPDPARLGGSNGERSGRQISIPVVYGGPDTDAVCRATGVGPAELAGLLTAARLHVAAVGFSPGFAYLTGVPPPLDRVARLPRPRAVVPAGSVALVAGMAAVYPQATPGGWSLIGWSPARLFDPTAPPYALLAPGDRVRFVRSTVRAADVAGATATGDLGSPAAPVATSGHPTLVVQDPGFQSLIQDGGRRGVASAGVPRGGPADSVAHGLANRLVGNRSDAGAIEMAVRGPTFTVSRDLQVAVVGPVPSVLVDGHDVGAGHLVPVTAGQVVEVGPIGGPRGGLRAYLAVAGGVDAPVTFNSRSTDTLSWFGPGALRSGDQMGLADDALGPPADRLSPAATGLVSNGRPSERGGAGTAGGPSWGSCGVRILVGPHGGHLAPGALDRLVTGRWTVEPNSDRVGIRLRDPAGGLERRASELRSVGMVEGAIQVPPDGMPVVLGRDHATLGGYPVVAVVIAADRYRLGQCRPGDVVSFTVVDEDEAATAWRALGRVTEHGVVGRYPSVAG